MKLEEIELGEDTESKMKAILKNLGGQVILYDSHKHWVHGVLLVRGNDHEVYQIHIEDPRGHRQLFYHDLQKLILLKPHKDSPLPKIDPFLCSAEYFPPKEK